MNIDPREIEYRKSVEAHIAVLKSRGQTGAIMYAWKYDTRGSKEWALKNGFNYNDKCPYGMFYVNFR